MKKIMFVVFIVMASLQSFAQVAVHDSVLSAQTVINVRATLSSLSANRAVLNSILSKESSINSTTSTISSNLSTFQQKTKDQLEEISARVGDPTKLNTGVYNSREASVSTNQTLDKIRGSVDADTELTDYDAEKLYGDSADPEYKYQVAEAAYINFEKVLEENVSVKKALIAKRGALALALKSVKSVAQVNKLVAALEVINGKLDTVREQEQQAFLKLMAIQIRNDQKSKKSKDSTMVKYHNDFSEGLLGLLNISDGEGND